MEFWLCNVVTDQYASSLTLINMFKNSIACFDKKINSGLKVVTSMKKCIIPFLGDINYRWH